jgi:hypothetical protein
LSMRYSAAKRNGWLSTKNGVGVSRELFPRELYISTGTHQSSGTSAVLCVSPCQSAPRYSPCPLARIHAIWDANRIE